MGISVLVYSHSNCLDVLKIFFSQLERHLIVDCDALSSTVVLIDEGTGSKVQKMTHLPIKVVEYSEVEGYSQQLLRAEALLDSYVLYLQEDFFLINDVRVSELEKKILLMQEAKLDLFRLIPSGYRRSKAHLESFTSSKSWVIGGLSYFRVDYLSSLPACMQATIWKKDVFMDMHKYSQVLNLREEWNEKYREFFRQNGVSGVSAKYPEFPYITVTAVKRGRWNFLDSDYAYKLMEILKRENVNPLDRGVVVTERKLTEPKGNIVKDCWRRLRYGR
jgi:hypothetical protein